MIYLPGTSWLHRLHPLTKFALALFTLVAANLFRWPPLLAGLLVLMIVASASAGVAGRLLRILLQVLLPLTFSLFVIQGILFPPADATAFATLGPLRFTYEGFAFAGVIALRLLTLSATVLLLVLTTHPADMANALIQIGLPHSIGYVVLVALQILPEMAARATGILEAQQSRGLEVRRGPGRILALPALVGPLLVGALSDVEERAMAIESRAFLSDGPKTVLRELHDTAGQRVLRWAVLLATVALVVLRFTVLRALL